MPKQPQLTFTEMLDMALASQTSGPGEKVSRQKIKAYITEHFSVRTDTDKAKESLKGAISERINEGLVVQDKGSFRFSPKGVRFYHEHYEEDGTGFEEGPSPTKRT